MTKQQLENARLRQTLSLHADLVVAAMLAHPVVGDMLTRTDRSNQPRVRPES